MKVLIETHTGSADKRDTFSIETSGEDMLYLTIDRKGSTGEVVGVPVMLDEFKALVRAFQLDKTN